jgi:hypothetical protein
MPIEQVDKMAALEFSFVMVLLGIGFSLFSAGSYMTVTNRVPAPSFEDDDGAVLLLAIMFRVVAGPAIILFQTVNAIKQHQLSLLALAWLVAGISWAGISGLAFNTLM